MDDDYVIWCENKGLLHHRHLKQDLGGDKAGKEGKGCVMCIIHRYNMQMMLPTSYSTAKQHL